MKRNLWLLSVILILGFTSVHAQSRPFGLGLMFGSPTGLSAKLWLSEASALDAGAAWSLYHDGYFRIHLDYLHHSYLINVSKGKLPLYYGIGGRVGFSDDVRVGLRVPVGLEYIFPNESFDIFFELVPGMDLLPATEFQLDGAIGCRYFF